MSVCGGRERLEVQALLLFLLAVAGEAVLGEKRFDDRVEAGRRRVREKLWMGGRLPRLGGWRRLLLRRSDDGQREDQDAHEQGTRHPRCASPVDRTRPLHLGEL